MSPAVQRSDDQKPALLMLHGFALDARMWRRQVEVFSDEFRIVTVDLPGFGAQARDVGEVSPAEEVGRAMDAAGLTSAHVLAASFGAAVATDFALRFPRRVQSLSFVGPQLLGRRLGIESWNRCVSLASDGDITTAAEVWLDDPLYLGLRHDEDLFEEVRQIVLDYGGAHWTGRVTSSWLDADPAPRLKELQTPALIMSGEGDLPSFLQMAEAYAKSLPRARREIVQGAGHMVNLEVPDHFNAVVYDFLQSLSR
ncbi:alpha/beta fold hydrolase [Labilithrix luteola]|nr:alpha/beta hydrolase [Labilithrix luteola]